MQSIVGAHARLAAPDPALITGGSGAASAEVVGRVRITGGMGGSLAEGPCITGGAAPQPPYEQPE
jgi:hypothetical protein